MSKLPLDLSKFKKTECDDNFTTLKHENGHIIKVCHGGLTGKLRADLEKMPLHKAKGGMIKGYDGGGDVSSQDSDNSSSQSPQAPVTINLGVPGAQQPVAPSGIPNALSASGQMGTNPTTGVPDALSPDASQTAPPAAQAGQQAQVATTPTPATSKADSFNPMGADLDKPGATKDPDFDVHQAISNHLNTQAQQVQQEMASGQIDPKDYNKVFNNESTPAKIGTLFGLLVGGIGSGLTHQPNAVMQMMEKTIDADNQSQAKNIEFAQKLKEINNQTLTANAGAKLTSAQADLAGIAFQQMTKNIAAVQNIVNFTKNLPEGPLKQQYMAQLQAIAPVLDEHNSNIADQAAARAALLSGPAAGGQDDGGEAAFSQRQKGLQSMGPWGQNLSNFEMEHHIAIPGMPEIGKQMANRPVLPQERNDFNSHQILDQKGRDLIAYAKAHEGTWSPDTRATAAQKAEEMINYYNSTLGGGGLTEGRLAWLDDQIKKNPTSIIAQELYGNQARLQEIVNSNINRRNQKLQSLGYKVPASSSGSSMEGKTAVNNKGQRIQYINGKWGPVQ